MKLLCPHSDPQFEQNVLDAQKRREGFGCRLSGKASFTEMQWEKQADPTVQSAGTTKKAGVMYENTSGSLSEGI